MAATAAINFKRSTARLFLLVYVTGVVTTTFLSNDAPAVVLTPAVYAAAKKGKADPLSMLFACALIANAASLPQRQILPAIAASIAASSGCG